MDVLVIGGFSELGRDLFLRGLLEGEGAGKVSVICDKEERYSLPGTLGLGNLAGIFAVGAGCPCCVGRTEFVGALQGAASLGPCCVWVLLPLLADTAQLREQIAGSMEKAGRPRIVFTLELDGFSDLMAAYPEVVEERILSCDEVVMTNLGEAPDASIEDLIGRLTSINPRLTSCIREQKEGKELVVLLDGRGPSPDDGRTIWTS